MCVSKTIWKGNEYGKRDNQDGIQADNRDPWIVGHLLLSNFLYPKDT